MTVLALTGGVGGAKLALGLYHALPRQELVCLVNTADDFEYLGLYISPDLDSLMYALAGESNPQTGWGRRDDSWQCQHSLQKYGVDTWFALGDRDLATHILRTQAMRNGVSLTEITEKLTTAMSVQCQILPMTDAKVSTLIQTKEGELSFQDYFVKQQCQPVITDIRFDGVEQAAPSPALLALLKKQLSCIVLCPSNPYISMAPLLALPNLVEALRANGAPIVAVSPIVGKQAIKGPAGKIMQESQLPVKALTVAKYYVEQYPGLLSGFVLDATDAEQLPEITALGLRAAALPSIMLTLIDKQRLAEQLLTQFAV